MSLKITCIQVQYIKSYTKDCIKYHNFILNFKYCGAKSISGCLLDPKQNIIKKIDCNKDIHFTTCNLGYFKLIIIDKCDSCNIKKVKFNIKIHPKKRCSSSSSSSSSSSCKSSKSSKPCLFKPKSPCSSKSSDPCNSVSTKHCIICNKEISSSYHSSNKSSECCNPNSCHICCKYCSSDKSECISKDTYIKSYYKNYPHNSCENPCEISHSDHSNHCKPCKPPKRYPCPPLPCKKIPCKIPHLYKKTPPCKKPCEKNPCEKNPCEKKPCEKKYYKDTKIECLLEKLYEKLNKNPCDKKENECDKPCETTCDKPCEIICETPCETTCDIPCQNPCEIICETPYENPTVKSLNNNEIKNENNEEQNVTKSTAVNTDQQKRPSVNKKKPKSKFPSNKHSNRMWGAYKSKRQKFHVKKTKAIQNA